MIQKKFEHFLRHWIAASPIAYRYMDNQFIERFFTTGEIRLTCYKKFRELYQDEIRGDDQEGAIDYRVWNKERDHHLTLRRKTGNHNFLLCTSLNWDTELMTKNNFDCDGCFRINDTRRFAFEISLKIQQFTYGLEGNCHYTKDGHVDLNIEDYGLQNFSKETLQSQLQNQELRETFEEISIRDTKLFFSKREKYQYQNEYRFIWGFQPSQIDHEFLVIKVPEAVKYCDWITK